MSQISLIGQLPAFVVASALLIIVPGPATILIMQRANRSRRSALAALFGIVLGDATLISLSGFGVSALLLRWPIALGAIKLLGASYLIYLAIGMLRTKPNTSEAPAADTPNSHLLKGLLLTLTNPKPLLFFSTFFPIFIPASSTSYALNFATLGLVFELINLLYFCIILQTFGRLSGITRSIRLNPEMLSKLSGTVLVACGTAMLIGIFV